MVCHNKSCRNKTRICANIKCGFRSNFDPTKFICKQCWAAEKANQSEEEESKSEKGGLKMVAQVIRHEDRFDIDDNFYEII